MLLLLEVLLLRILRGDACTSTSNSSSTSVGIGVSDLSSGSSGSSRPVHGVAGPVRGAAVVCSSSS